jgi:hypothetical protein
LFAAQKLQNKLQPFYNEYSKKLQSVLKGDDSPEAKREGENKAQEVLKQKEFQALQEELQNVFATVRKFQRPHTYQGFVWLYLRKAPAAGSN